MSQLEARARLLLRAYPPDYRADRGQEILGTLLDTSPADRSWPAPREAWSLVTGGLRVRATGNRHDPFTTNLRLALLLAAALGLAANPMYRWLWWVNGVPPSGAALAAGDGACAVLVAATVGAPWFARRGVTISLALTAALALGLLAYHVEGFRFGVTYFVLPPLALAVIVALEPARPPRHWLAIPASAFLASALLFFVQTLVDYSPGLSSVVGIAGTVLVDGIGCAVLLWIAVDARPAIAVAIYLEVFYGLPGLGYAVRYGWFTPGLTSRVLLIPLAVGVLAMTRLRARKAERSLRITRSGSATAGPGQPARPADPAS
jgi:hypothetical protein